jgi:hypothetical protein
MRILSALLLLALLLALTACGAAPINQGMVSADKLTFIVSTVTDAKEGTVAVTVAMTNGTGDALYLSAPEREGGETYYLNLSLGGMPCERDALTESGLVRWLNLDARETYTETCTFSGVLPAELTVTVYTSPTYAGEFLPTTVTLPLRAE